MNKKQINVIYKEKKDLIEKVMSTAMGKIFDSIENDDLDLSTDENQNLCLKLMDKWING